MKILYPSERKEIAPALRIFSGKIVSIKDEWGKYIYGHDIDGEEIIFKNVLTLASAGNKIKKTCER